MTHPDPSGIEIRVATEAEFPALVRVLYDAFGETSTPDELANELTVLEVGRVFGAFDGGAPIGVSAAFTFRLTVPGGEVGAAGVTLVGVLPTHTRRGIMRSMMVRLLDQARERGEAVAILGASEAAIYQRFGYGMATQIGSIEAAKDKLRFLSPVDLGGRVRMLTRDEAADRFPPIFEVLRRTRPGSLTRSDAKWREQIVNDADWMRQGNGPKVNALLEVGGEARAYAIYRIKVDWDAAGPKHTLLVIEVVGVDQAAEQAMWQWLLSIDLVATVTSSRRPVPDPLQLRLTEPRRLLTRVSDGMWLRIVDLPAAFEARSYRGEGRLVLDVTDEFVPSNAGRWQFTVPRPGGAGRASIARVVSQATEPDLALDISALATVYLGTFTISDLARAGRITECRPGALAEADALFATTVAPWNTTMF